METKLVGLMAKYPERGLVKTRLAKGVGENKALEIYKSMLTHTIKQCQPLPADDYRLIGFVTPSHRSEQFAEEYPELTECLPQSDGLLGSKMKHALALLMDKSSAQKSVLIGADIPGLNRELILTAFKKLDRCEVVWGPTLDGGYYLIGMNEPLHGELLTDRIPWGTDQVLGQSIELAKTNYINYRLLPPLDDLDDMEDLLKFPNFNK